MSGTKEVTALFKLKRSKRKIRLSSELGEGKQSLGRMIAEAFPDEESLYRDEAPEAPEAQACTASEISGEAASKETTASEGAAPAATAAAARVQAVNVVHPWNVVDYHLYLNSVEGEKDERERRNSMYLFDGSDCRPFLYDEFFNPETFDPAVVGDELKLLFAILPLAEPGPSFNGVQYLLGFDLREQIFFIRCFYWLPEDISDVWSVWNEGHDVYQFSVAAIYTIMKESFKSEDGKVNITPLNFSPYCDVLAHDTDNDPGMDMVIVILCSQWLVDLADVLFQDDDVARVQGFKNEIDGYQNQWRLVLQRASYRAWSALRDGLPKQRACGRKSSWSQVMSDLYTFDKSKGWGSMVNKSWRAPSQDTCDRIRQRCWNQWRKEGVEHVEKRFEQLFTKPDASSRHPVFSLGSPQTPPPVVAPESRPASPTSVSPLSDGIVAPMSELTESDTQSSHDDLSLAGMLRSMLDLAEMKPEMDTPDNRRRVGALMTELGISAVDRESEEHKHVVIRQKHDSGYGYEAEGWAQQLKAMGDFQEDGHPDRPVPRLLPSPVID
ncbi:hypothetical protein VTN02DRAFT_5159 [Thermoascus thermophilus]